MHSLCPYIQISQTEGLVIDKQTSPDLNWLFTFTQDTERLCAESTSQSCYS